MRAAVAAGVDWVQVRDRMRGGCALLDFVRGVAAAGAERGEACTVLLNRRSDVALAAGAQDPGLRLGVHLGFDALPLEETRRVLRALGGVAGPVGVAAHGPEEVAAAAQAGADYVHLAPIFDPLSKPPERPALGTEALARASQLLEMLKLPKQPATILLAQGGIDAETAVLALRAGARGVAVTGAILEATHPGDAAARLRATLDGNAPDPP